MTSRYEIAEAARAEVAETFGEMASLSIYAVVCARRGLYAPVGADGFAGPAIPLFPDQVKEVRA